MIISKQPAPKPMVWVLLVGTLLLQRTANAYLGPHRLSPTRIQEYRLGVSQNTLPEPTPLSPISRTTTTISRLPSFRDEDPITAWLALMRTVVQPISLMVSLSLLVAVCLVGWEDYGATNLWPSRHMIVITSRDDTGSSTSNDFGMRTIHGMGFGKSERQKILQDNANSPPGTSSLLPEIRAYNEVSEEHRLERVARWHEPQSAATSQKMMGTAVADLQDILLQVLQLQTLVGDYQWDQVHSTIQTSITPKLEPAASVVRRYVTDQLSSTTTSKQGGNDKYNIGYEEIGFDWGSCAWRHCGALADAQEALDEMDHLLGVLEPPECLFCLDIVERSIRDILAVVPAEFHAAEGIPAYKPYQSLHVTDDSMGDLYGEESDVLDQEYLKMLQELRSSSSADDNDEA